MKILASDATMDFRYKIDGIRPVEVDGMGYSAAVDCEITCQKGSVALVFIDAEAVLPYLGDTYSPEYQPDIEIPSDAREAASEIMGIVCDDLDEWYNSPSGDSEDHVQDVISASLSRQGIDPRFVHIETILHLNAFEK